ncbi:hypothetical protein GH714_038356 [Hevea brasiliensis]|uniref:G protein gamma domain-containing protein n=1 Tax=Hevea brasiliensis TaxID=3981 RepID=A0A6A6KFP2_HEVBR|nr:hypothetical protein GH714_038356 [Hevea brasiliensis]
MAETCRVLASAKSGCSSSVPSLPPPCPKSPPEYPDLYGKRREMAKVQMLEREIGFLEEELKSVDSLQPASRCCKENISLTFSFQAEIERIEGLVDSGSGYVEYPVLIYHGFVVAAIRDALFIYTCRAAVTATVTVTRVVYATAVQVFVAQHPSGSAPLARAVFLAIAIALARAPVLDPIAVKTSQAAVTAALAVTAANVDFLRAQIALVADVHAQNAAIAVVAHGYAVVQDGDALLQDVLNAPSVPRP